VEFGFARRETPVLAENVHPLKDQRVSPNNPNRLSILKSGSLKRDAFSASTTGTDMIYQLPLMLLSELPPLI
jgi:hypothetical protein